MSNDNGNGPWWAKWTALVGIPGFLLAFLLGAIPGLHSPLFAVHEVRAAMAAHRAETRRLIDVMALMCAGVWRGDSFQQEACANTAKIIRDDDASAR